MNARNGNPLEPLKQRLLELRDLEATLRVLSWDQATYMPSGGGAARGRQIAIIGELCHEHLSDPELGRLLQSLQTVVADLPADHPDVSLVKVAWRDHQRAVRVPPSGAARTLRPTYSVRSSTPWWLA